jgi:hypothetical protein
MKLIEAIKEKGRPFTIPDCGRDSLPDFFKELGFKVGAEIGTYRGEFAEKFCKEGLKLYAIDPWMGYEGAGRTEQKQDKQDLNYEEAKKVLAPYPDCLLIRETSREALKLIPDGSLDFVYLDGDHRFQYIAEDLVEWSKKVRTGGIVSGHDYFNTDPWANNVQCQVGAVVDAFVKSFGIETFYVFKPLIEKSKGDSTPSWFYIKQ